MNSNKLERETLKELAKMIAETNSQDEVLALLNEILTDGEISALSKRWRILSMLSLGQTQREIAKELQVSLCKVTRGAKVIKNKNAVVTKYLIKEKNNNEPKITDR